MNRAYAAEAFCARGRALGPGCAESGMSRAAAWGEPGFAIRLCLPIFGLSTRAVCARANFLRKTNFGVVWRSCVRAFFARSYGADCRGRATGETAGGFCALRVCIAVFRCVCATKKRCAKGGIMGRARSFLAAGEGAYWRNWAMRFFFAAGNLRVSRVGFRARRARGERGESSKKNRSICRENSGNIETLRKWEQGL